MKNQKPVTLIMLLLITMSTILQPMSVLGAENLHEVELEQLDLDVDGIEVVTEGVVEPEAEDVDHTTEEDVEVKQEDKSPVKNKGDPVVEEPKKETVQQEEVKEVEVKEVEEVVEEEVVDVIKRDQYFESHEYPQRFSIASSSSLTVPTIIDYHYEAILSDGTPHASHETGIAYFHMDGEVVFCIQHGMPAFSGPGYVFHEMGKIFTGADRDIMSKIVYYGYDVGDPATPRKNYAITQMMLYEQMGSTITWTSVPDYEQQKAEILKKVAAAGATPEFSGQTVQLKVGESQTLTDGNGVLSQFSVSKNTTGSIVSINGNQLTITATENSVENGTIEFTKYDASEMSGTTLVYEKPGSQTMGKFGWSDQVPFEIHVAIEKPKEGSIRIIKKDSTTTVTLEGATYEVYDGNTLVDTVTTGADGTVTTKALKSGVTYTIIEIKAPEGYVVDPTPKEVTVAPETIAEHTQENRPILGEMELTKKDLETGKMLPGAKFQIKNASGEVVATGTTDENGVAKFTALRYGSYVYQETEAPKGFILDKTERPFEIRKDGEVVKLEMVNAPKPSEFLLTKTDVATGDPLPNAKFEIKDSKGEVVASGTTDENGIATFDSLLVGKYTYREFEAPKGYVIDESEFPFEIKEYGQIVKAEMTNKSVVGKIEVVKNNKTGEFIEGTVYEIKDSTGKVVDTVTTGKNGKATSKQLPLGAYTVIEKSVPKPYLLDTTPMPVELKYKDQTTPVVTGKVVQVNETVVGKVEVTKNSKTGDVIEGAVFEVKDSKGKVVDTITTGTSGKATTKSLPLGKYTVVEKSVPSPYILDTTPMPVELKYKDQTTSVVTGKVVQENESANGKIEVVKNNKTGEFIEGTVFEVKDSTGKVVDTITTGKDGKAVSKVLPLGKYTVVEKSVPKPYLLDTTPMSVELKYKDQTTPVVTSKVTQVNERAIGEVKLVKLDYKSFEGVTDAVYGLYTLDGKEVQRQTTKKGGEALFKNVSLGEYYIQEIEAPKGYVLDTTKYPVIIEYINSLTPVVFVGLEVEQVREPVIGTTASFVGLEKHDPNLTTLVDVVAYENLIVGKDYEVKGFLMDKNTNEPILIDGKRVEGKTKFTAKTIDGSVEVAFRFDQSKLKTDTIVVFEDLYQGKTLVAVHHDINDKAQTVEIPKVKTEASFVELDKVNPNITTLVDIVHYDNLIVGKEYEVTGKLMDKATGKPVLIDGKEVTGKTKFTTEAAKGSVEVKFTFDQSKLKTDTVVVFEDLYQGETLIAVHHDIKDKEQTVEIPKVKTTASFVELDKKNTNMTTLVDIVHYDNLIVGKEYEVTGKLMDKTTGKPVLIDGKEVTGKTKFKPKATKGSVEVKFTFDQSKLKTDTVVVFEDLYQGETLIAVHHDINDVEQTVEIPKVKTSASFVGLEKHDPNLTTLVDVVYYENLLVGKEYEVTGKLMDKATGKPVLIDGKEISGSKKFKPKASKGSVEVEFRFDQSKLKTDTIVVFEDLYRGDKLIAVHHDINDKEQTVEIPKVKTSASFVELDKENPNMTTLVDIVYYENLLVGKEYVVNGKLMDKATNKPVLIDGKEVTGQTKFTAKESKGSVEVKFTFDQSKLKTDTVVVFEDLYQGKALIAVHHDINDVEQTVEIPKVKTSASFVELDQNDSNITTLVDVVYYENLLVGKEYVVNGTLMDKTTGKPVLIDGEEVTGSTTFTAEEAKGSVEVKFIFDQSKLETETVVVFEDLYQGDTLIAVHHDINDIEQTVEIPKVKTAASFVERDKEETNNVTLVDVVTYNNLLKGKEYVVNGKLMDKVTGEPVLIDGEEVTGSTTFTAEEANGEVKVYFTFDQSKLKTDAVVVFEDVYQGETLVAVHHDITDKDQTVEVIEVKVVKTGSVSGELLEGAEFTMYDTEGNVLDVQVTDKDGIARFNIIEGEKILIKETKAPEGYVLDTEASYEVVGDAEEKVVELNVVNKRITGDVEITKVDSADKGKTLKGAKFELRDLNGEVVAKGTTDNNGKLTFKDLEYGSYTLHETKAPKGYELNGKVYEVVISVEGETVKVEVANDKTPVKVAEIPQAGFKSNMLAGILGVLLIALGGFIYYRKKKEDKQ